jgi:hypothetical protein
VRRSDRDRGFDAKDALAALAGGVVGLAVGFVAGSSLGRVNSRRIKSAVSRLRGRQAVPKVWNDEEAERLEARVLDALAQDVVLARRPIRVAVLGLGLVELTGTVRHSTEIGLAGDIVQGTVGVRTVLNHLLVGGAEHPSVTVPGPNAPRAARG